MSEMAELKPCPFCGSKVDFQYDGSVDVDMRNDREVKGGNE